MLGLCFKKAGIRTPCNQNLRSIKIDICLKVFKATDELRYWEPCKYSTCQSIIGICEYRTPTPRLLGSPPHGHPCTICQRV